MSLYVQTGKTGETGCNIDGNHYFCKKVNPKNHI